MQAKSSGSVKIFYPEWTKEELVKKLREGVARLSLLLPVKEVILFGSWARGAYTVASDVDLLVIYEGEKRGDAFSLVKKTVNVSRLEPHVYTEEEFNALGPSFKAAALQGLLIYKKSEVPMLAEKPINQFMDELASSAPAPGGGSVAALAGAMGAALVSMVCNLTIGKKKYADVEEEIKAILEQSETLRREFLNLLEADVAAYTKVSEAMKMPRETEEQKVVREEALDKALKEATEVPLRVAEACVKVIDLCRPVAEKGNVNAVSDAGVAVVMAEAGLRSAALNVLINLGWLKDEAFKKEAQARLDKLLEGKAQLKEEIYEFVKSKL